MTTSAGFGSFERSGRSAGSTSDASVAWSPRSKTQADETRGVWRRRGSADSSTPTGATADDGRDARAAVDRFIAELGWQVRPDAAARAELADTLVALRHLGRGDGTDVFRPYAGAAGRMAAWEVASIPTSEPRSVAVERMVVGTVVFGAVFDALRRLAHEHYSATQA